MKDQLNSSDNLTTKQLSIVFFGLFLKEESGNDMICWLKVITLKM